MKLSEFKANLTGMTTVSFQLPDGSTVPSHFHITEVGHVQKRFIDCGGTTRLEDRICFQLWEAEDFDHRLASEKLMKIIELSERTLNLPDEEIEVEYQGETIEMCHYPIASWNGLRKGRVHLHGHCHLPNHKKFGNGRRLDVGIDGNADFAPYDLRIVINDMKKRPIGSELGVDDHHIDELKNVVG